MKLFRFTQTFFLLNATQMLVVGILTLVRPPQSTVGLAVFTAILLFIDAALLLGCSILISKRQKWPNLAAVAVLLANILLTVFDDFGLPDLVILLLFLANLVLLILTTRQGKLPAVLQT